MPETSAVSVVAASCLTPVRLITARGTSVIFFFGICIALIGGLHGFVPRSFQHVPVKVGAADGGVTDRAGLILRCLIMEIGCPRSSAESGRGVAFQAEKIQVAGLDQTRIGRSVGRMAGHATFRLNG